MNSSNEIAEDYAIKRHSRLNPINCDEFNERAIPERRLWAAVLLDGIIEKKEKQSSYIAKRYFDHQRDCDRLWREGKTDGVGSLTWICEMLDLDVNQFIGRTI